MRKHLRWLWTLPVVALAVLWFGGFTAGASTPYSLFPTGTPATLNTGDAQGVELGVKFEASQAGQVTAIRFYKGTTSNGGTHTGHLWTTSGTRLGSVTFSSNSGTGWQQASFSTPVNVSANMTYIASYYAPRGYYSATNFGLTNAFTNGPLSSIPNATSADGVYRYGSTSGFPTSTYQATNYWVDVVFVPNATTSPTSTTSTTITTSSTSSTTSSARPPTATGSSSTTTTSTANINFTPIDGGPNYFSSHFTNTGAAWADQHILLGGWNENPASSADVGYDTALGNNTYFNLSGNPRSGGSVDYNVMNSGGMHGFMPSKTANSGSETIGYFGIDEADGDFGGGTNGFDSTFGGGWNTGSCNPSGSSCGLSVASWFHNGATCSGCGPASPAGAEPAYWPKNDSLGNHPVMQEITKCTSFAPNDGCTTSQAQRFLTSSDVNDADMYWFIDGDLRAASQGGCAFFPTSPTYCTNVQHGYDLTLSQAQAELAANYQWQVDSLRKLNSANGGRSVPIVGTVEAGTCLWNTNQNQASQLCANHNQYIAAAWHTMIAGARGIIWFVSNLASRLPVTCDTYDIFYDGQDPSSSSPCSGLNGHNTPNNNGETFAQTDSYVSAVNHQMLHYQNVLLSPTATNYVTSTTGDVSTLAKADGNGGFVVFAGSGQMGTPPAVNQSVTFTLSDAYTGPVQVDGPTGSENRTVQATNGVFSDTFADKNAIHIYQIPS